MLLDKSQVIAVGLIRRKIVQITHDLIRCKFSIDAKLWRIHALVPCPPIRNHNGGALETRHSPSARAERPKDLRGYGVLPRDGSP
jgi:hypothetical protein